MAIFRGVTEFGPCWYCDEVVDMVEVVEEELCWHVLDGCPVIGFQLDTGWSLRELVGGWWSVGLVLEPPYSRSPLDVVVFADSEVVVCNG